MPTPTLDALSEQAALAALAALGAACRTLHLPTVCAHAGALAEVAARQKTTHLGYLAGVLSVECDEREPAAAPAGSPRRNSPGSKGWKTSTTPAYPT